MTEREKILFEMLSLVVGKLEINSHPINPIIDEANQALAKFNSTPEDVVIPRGMFEHTHRIYIGRKLNSNVWFAYSGNFELEAETLHLALNALADKFKEGK